MLHVLRTTCQSYRHKEAAAPEQLAIYTGCFSPRIMQYVLALARESQSAQGRGFVTQARSTFHPTIGHGPSSQAGPASAKAA